MEENTKNVSFGCNHGFQVGDTVTFNLPKLLNLPWYKRIWIKIKKTKNTYKVVKCYPDSIVIK